MTDSLLSLPPLSLYVHIPWCVRKCPYCDFNSHAASEELPEEEYVLALIRDLDIEEAYVQGRKLTSIFFGGGTPSLFSVEAIGRIIQAANRRIGFEDDIEITLEANPGTFEQEKFIGYRSVGVNRLSIGVQSFNDQKLTQLGRIHSAEQAITAIKSAGAAGFANFNLDLMHGLPGQTTVEAMADLQQAIDLAPTHISWYQLTIEPNTEFYSKPPTL
ncbi:MAG: radical SAM family heme chaperone HemW, partial [Porticoccus sp.]|nr:radical SAM family heme chaperone HemW [Porticoccus sp.]